MQPLSLIFFGCPATFQKQPSCSFQYYSKQDSVLFSRCPQYRGACPSSKSDTELQELVERMGGDEAKIQSALDEWWQSERNLVFLSCNPEDLLAYPSVAIRYTQPFGDSILIKPFCSHWRFSDLLGDSTPCLHQQGFKCCIISLNSGVFSLTGRWTIKPVVLGLAKTAPIAVIGQPL